MYVPYSIHMFYIYVYVCKLSNFCCLTLNKILFHNCFTNISYIHIQHMKIYLELTSTCMYTMYANFAVLKFTLLMHYIIYFHIFNCN